MPEAIASSAVEISLGQNGVPAAAAGTLAPAAEGDDAVAAILGVLSFESQSRAEIIALSGIDEAEWPRAITAIVDKGLATRTGSKRGSRYQLSAKRAGEAIVRVGPGATRERGMATVPTRSLVEASYHDILDELLGGLLARESEPNACEYGSALPVQAPPTLIRALEAFGVDVMDHRKRGGALWVVDSPEARLGIAAAARTFNVQFTRAANSHACGGRPGWWTKDES